MRSALAAATCLCLSHISAHAVLLLLPAAYPHLPPTSAHHPAHAVLLLCALCCAAQVTESDTHLSLDWIIRLAGGSTITRTEAFPKSGERCQLGWWSWIGHAPWAQAPGAGSVSVMCGWAIFFPPPSRCFLAPNGEGTACRACVCCMTWSPKL